MKKGLLLALLMVAVVAMAFPAHAKAPIIKDLPDIVIGDTNDINGSGTSAERLYRYLNIANLLDANVIEWLNGAPLSEHYVFLYQPTASEPTIQASTDAALLDQLTGAEYTALLGSGTVPAVGDNLIDYTTSFTYLSLMNTDIVGTLPSDAYSATAAANGMATGSIPSGDFGDTDLILVAAEVPLSTTSPTLVSESPDAFTVTTVMDSDDYTTGATDVLFDFQFPGGSVENWYALTNFGLADFGAATSSIDTTNGGIGWDATGAGGGALGANYGTWYLSDDGANAKFLIPGGGMDGKVYRVRAGLISDQATRAATCSWRLLALSYQTVAWQGVQVLTSGADETDAPISTDSSFETQIHFTPPYELSEWADGGALDATDWVAVGDVNAPADGRDYTLTFDGLDVGDSGHMWMDYCVVESYARPADKTTPDLEWGAGATAFNDAANGFNFPTTSAFPTLALLPTPDAGTRTADYVTLAMGALPGGSDTGLARWSQASQAPASVTQKYAEVAGDLLRYTIHSYSPSPDTAPVVRYQTTPFNAAGSAADQTIWFDAFGPFDTRLHLTNSGTVDAPGSPKTTVAGGSDVDVYRYVMRTTTGRWLHFYWDAYGLPVSTAQAANGWASQTGAITVTSIVLNGALPNP